MGKRRVILLFIIAIGFDGHSLSTEEIVDATTINLLWMNKEKPKVITESNAYVFPEPYKRGLSKNNDKIIEQVYSFNRVQLWAQLNPKTKIRIWHDASTAAENAVENTMAKFKELGVDTQIEIVDINSIKDHDKNYKFIFDQELPPYYQFDIFRVLISYTALTEALKRNEIAFSLYADWSIDPIGLKQLYSYGGGRKNIENYGIIFGKTDQASYENSFHVMGNNHPNLLIAIKALINKNLIRAHLTKDKTRIKEQAVYGDYPDMIQFFHALEGRATISQIESSSSDIEKFEFDQPVNLKGLSIEELKSHAEFETMIPTKNRNPLFIYDKEGLSDGFVYQPSEELTKQFPTGFSFPTRSCISKSSKLSN